MKKPREQDTLDVANLIERFVGDTCGPYEWDNFLNEGRKDLEIQKIREECEQVEINFPARSDSEWCSPEGGHALLGIASRLRVEISRAAQASGRGAPSE